MTKRNGRKPKPTTGALIRAARLDAGLTQVDIAERSGIAQYEVSAYECGRKEPQLATLRRLAAAIGVEPGELVGGGT